MASHVLHDVYLISVDFSIKAFIFLICVAFSSYEAQFIRYIRIYKALNHKHTCTNTLLECPLRAATVAAAAVVVAATAAAFSLIHTRITKRRRYF